MHNAVVLLLGQLSPCAVPVLNCSVGHSLVGISPLVNLQAERRGKANPSSPSKAAQTCQAGGAGGLSDAVDAEMTV